MIIGVTYITVCERKATAAPATTATALAIVEK
jgi:hypothetical protein